MRSRNAIFIVVSRSKTCSIFLVFRKDLEQVSTTRLPKTLTPSVSSLSIRIGWREFVALPRLGLPVLKAKVDTGARTSALHAFKIESFNRDGLLMVRFHVHPIQHRTDIAVVCEAPVIDHRVVTDSGGHRERRYVIETTLVINNQQWPIEVTLTNRENMVFRMLLGRSAMHSLVVQPSASYVLGRPEKVIRAYLKPKQAHPSSKVNKIRPKVKTRIK